MTRPTKIELSLLAVLLAAAITASAAPENSPTNGILKTPPITMAELGNTKTAGVSVREVSDYVFGGYKGDFPSPPHADLNPKKAFVIFWKDLPFRFVFAHEGSYCPWYEFPSGSAQCFQFFEGNDGWAELFNNFGRMEQNSFVEVLESGPKRVWVRWIYFGVNQDSGKRAYRGTEDFWAFPNGHILRKQSFETLMPHDHRGYAREPIEMIAMSPVGKMWYDVLEKNSATGESHALAVLDAFSTNRYDLYWQRKPGTLFEATPRRAGCTWKFLDDSRGVALVIPQKEAAPFCVMGDAGGYGHEFTRIKEHTYTDTGGLGWVSRSWDHWPIGWLNSQANEVNAESLKKYPNHFSPAGMDTFGLSDEQTEGRVFYSLIGVGGRDLEAVRKVAQTWLDAGETGTGKPDVAAKLPRIYTP